MHEPFILELTYQNKPYELPAAFQCYGYIYRTSVSINDVAYIFELDEEGNYRVPSTTNTGQPLPDTGLLQVITAKLNFF